ncbi:PhnA-like protein [Bradyrhizobium sp. Leo170]|nr:PhnA-like protein [Bradyrhizobium sp. Leo170]
MTYSPDVSRSTDHRNPPQASAVAPADEVRTIMLNQISWGAVFAGATIALVMQMILNMIGIGVGLSTVDVVAGDTPSAGSLSIGAGIWWVISGIVAAAIGGYIAGRLSGKASQSTTAYHGLIAWAVSTLIVVYLLSSAASGLIGGALSTASSALGGAGKAVGGSVQTAVQTAAPSLNNMSDPMATIENKVRSASGGQDPAALREAAATAVRAALSGDPAQQAAATDKAADALAKAQNISLDEAKAQVAQYQQQYRDMIAKAKLQAKQAADTTAKTVSRGALFGALALLLGALAAFFAGQAGAVTPTVTRGSARSFT